MVSVCPALFEGRVMIDVCYCTWTHSRLLCPLSCICCIVMTLLFQFSNFSWNFLMMVVSAYWMVWSTASQYFWYPRTPSRWPMNMHIQLGPKLSSNLIHICISAQFSHILETGVEFNSQMIIVEQFFFWCNRILWPPWKSWPQALISQKKWAPLTQKTSYFLLKY